MMTRERDEFLPLVQRREIAHKHDADVFLSIHADASTDRDVSGSSVYSLPTGSSECPVLRERLRARGGSGIFIAITE